MAFNRSVERKNNFKYKCKQEMMKFLHVFKVVLGAEEEWKQLRGAPEFGCSFEHVQMEQIKVIVF